MSRDGLDLIYFSNVEWDFTWQRPQQLASRLGRYGNVLYVNPLGVRSIAVKDLGRVVRRLTLRVKTGDARLSVHRPLFYLPFPNNQLANRINGRLLRCAIAPWLSRHHVESPVVWVGTPSPGVVEAVRGLNPRLLIYDCIDDVALFHERPGPIIRAEQSLAGAAQVVLASAEELYARMKRLNPETFLVRNAADFEHFSRAGGAGLRPADELARMRRPVLGYVGGMAQWFDFELVRNLAMENPCWEIVLVGPIQREWIEAWKLGRLPNVHHLGRRDYAALPAYLRGFDVCLLPFKVDAVTAAVSPVKLYEYLAAGKPVVSTPIKEVLRYRNVVEIAERGEFSRAVAAALRSRTDEAKIRQRAEVARQNTWEARIEEIVAIFRRDGVFVPRADAGARHREQR